MSAWPLDCICSCATFEVATYHTVATLYTYFYPTETNVNKLLGLSSKCLVCHHLDVKVIPSTTNKNKFVSHQNYQKIIGESLSLLCVKARSQVRQQLLKLMLKAFAFTTDQNYLASRLQHSGLLKTANLFVVTQLIC